MTTKAPITVAHGDGIGPEIMDATLSVLKEAGAAIDIEPIGDWPIDQGRPELIGCCWKGPEMKNSSLPLDPMGTKFAQIVPSGPQSFQLAARVSF
jgi:hypothetical protein